MKVVWFQGPGCNKDDATSAGHTGKAENPEENPAKVLAVTFCLFVLDLVCLYKLSVSVSPVKHHCHILPVIGHLRRVFRRTSISSPWIWILGSRFFPTTSSSWILSACYHDSLSSSPHFIFWWLWWRCCQWWWRWPCCIYPDSWHAGQRIAQSWSLSQGEAPAHLIFSFVFSKLPKVIIYIVSWLVYSSFWVDLFLDRVTKAAVIPWNVFSSFPFGLKRIWTNEIFIQVGHPNS